MVLDTAPLNDAQ